MGASIGRTIAAFRCPRASSAWPRSRSRMARVFSRSTCERSTSSSVATPAWRRFFAISRCFSFWRDRLLVRPRPSPGSAGTRCRRAPPGAPSPAGRATTSSAPSSRASRAARMALPSLKLKIVWRSSAVPSKRFVGHRRQAVAQLGRERVEAAAVEQARVAVARAGAEHLDLGQRVGHAPRRPGRAGSCRSSLALAHVRVGGERPRHGVRARERLRARRARRERSAGSRTRTASRSHASGSSSLATSVSTIASASSGVSSGRPRSASSRRAPRRARP